MVPLELDPSEELVRQYVPELIPRLNLDDRIASVFAGFMLAACLAALTLYFAVGNDGSLARAMMIVGTSVCGVAGAALSDRLLRRDHEARVKGFADRLRRSPWQFYEALAAKFALEVERQRARTLGPASEWGQARQRLEDAVQEVSRSQAYWTHRMSTDSAHEVAEAQLRTAAHLHEKFQSALTELDGRARVLVAFFNDCEARLGALQGTKRDLEEVRKLDVLTERAGEIVSSAHDTLDSIAATFVSEAVRVGTALGGLERLGLLNLAAVTPVDRIEELADRIIENSSRDRTALERLANDISD